ncbi:hypothetical protein L1987_32644 [Smallanthus sonchifolius]|uniref:Uncharacterized protein n=1 Tax=Smallanthus sonchifolius TaxID=185202 RepID=A0ACB9HQ02_9ASTR|nr:hypothetical protein L1987_32644 [Smallanthus sonchifolius]
MGIIYIIKVWIDKVKEAFWNLSIYTCEAHNFYHLTIARDTKMSGKKFHTIISRELIKPSTPTPSNLNTYNLSELDIIAGKIYAPLFLVYPNNGNCSLTAQDKARVLKKSLSESLTRFYHFAGRLSTHTTPYIDCNDEGVVFLVAKIDSKLDEFQLNSELDEHPERYFADDMVCYNSPHNTSLFGFQLNHFACGGVAVAVSISHLIADACTIGLFMNHWASLARYGSPDHKEVLPFSPSFIHSPRTHSILSHAPAINQEHNNHVTRTFVFPNSKLSDLKNKVSATINNPTRVEVLTSLLYKTVVAAATTNYGCFNPSYLHLAINIHDKFVEKLPQTTIGTLATFMLVPTRHISETSLTNLVAEIKKEKMRFGRIQSVQEAAKNMKSLISILRYQDLENGPNRKYGFSSLCGFSFDKVDFGWGKPMATAFAFRSVAENSFLLLDAVDGNGIEARVILDKEVMEIFQNDKEMLSFCQTNNFKSQL